MSGVLDEFSFVHNSFTNQWIISAPHRSKRPNASKTNVPICPFCLGREIEEPDVYRVGGEKGDSNWNIRVINNKFPFAPIHEVIIHSPDHHKNFDELPLSAVELILTVYKQRYETHRGKGQIYIFHNRGERGGESLPHPHTQLAVVPFEVSLTIPRLHVDEKNSETQLVTDQFVIYCPLTSFWPDEVWIFPRERGKSFGQSSAVEITALAKVLQQLLVIFDMRYGHEFPFNFYIYPGNDWYLRIIPRLKTLGGFEVGTGIMVNTQDPLVTMAFIKSHFEDPNEETIKTHHLAEYRVKV